MSLRLLWHPVVRVALPLLLLWCAAGVGAANSVWVFPGPSGRLLRQPDALGNRILDYTEVGYRGGRVPLPEVPVRVTLAPVAGDDGAQIQAGINQVQALPLDTNGFRGAVLLTAGEYQISSSITINASGIVLRGVGDSATGTVLRAAGAGQRTLVRVTGSGSPATVSGTTRTITNLYVPVGARSFNVDYSAGFAPGDRVFVRRNANSDWITAMGMDLLCCPPESLPWDPTSYVLDFDRVITRVEGNRITVDAPVPCAIEQRWGGGTLRKYTWSGRITNVGVEHLRGVSDYVGAEDEDHGWVFVEFRNVEHAWARKLTSLYFGYACVGLYGGAKSVTVQDSQCLDPVSIITGGRRYAFIMEGCQLALVQNCYTRKDRHQFVTQARTSGPNVFVDGLSDTAYSDAGPHHRWGTGALWDSVTVNGNALNVQNRGNSGTGHGWAGANEVVWNCAASGGFIVQNPPTARNWLIGSVGTIRSGTMYVGPHDPGTYDAHGANVFPNSLYYAQLQDRLAAAGLETREYWLGDLDGFNPTNPTGEAVPVDAAWRSAAQAAAGSAAVRGFDLVATNQWVPFTCSFSLATNERIVGASLALALRGTTAAAAGRTLYFDALTNGLSFASLGWTSLGIGTNTTVRVLDLANRLAALADGRLDLAIQGDVGVDWVLLELHVAPVVTAFTNALLPAADAYVRAGAHAALNFGTAATLDVKLDNSADVNRRAYLRWDLSGVTGTVLEARVRLTHLSVGTNVLEHGLALATSSAWSETALTWNNQPGAGKRFATWMAAAGVPVEIVVTPQVQATLAGDRQLSLQLVSLVNVGGPGNASYAAREHTNPALRPQLLLVFSNSPPTISSFAPRALAAGHSTGPLPFTVADAETPAADLTVRATASNPLLVPPEGLALGGAGANRTLSVTPAPGETGNELITVTVTDAHGLGRSTAFTLTVTNPPAPRFIQAATAPDGGFTLTAAGADGLNLRLFATTNLALPFSVWSPLATGVLAGGSFTHTDPPDTNRPRRFYRLSVP
jgi:hypothetical protein